MNTTSVLIPFRGDGGQRDRIWSHLKKLWEETPYQIVIGSDDSKGAFNIARAFNDARSKATGENLVCYSADHMPSVEAIEEALQRLEHNAWAPLFESTAAHTSMSTEQILAGKPPTEAPTITPLCVAIIAIRAENWISYDERFQGWGSEDRAWRHALQALYDDTPAPQLTSYALYHEPASRAHAEDNYRLYCEYVAAHNAGTMLHYLETHGLIKRGLA